jgi:hypothetical protein
LNHQDTEETKGFIVLKSQRAQSAWRSQRFLGPGVLVTKDTKRAKSTKDSCFWVCSGQGSVAVGLPQREPGAYMARAALHSPLRRRGRPAMVGGILLLVQVGDGVDHCNHCGLQISDCGLLGPQSCGRKDILCREDCDTWCAVALACFTSIVKHRVLLGDFVSSFHVYEGIRLWLTNARQLDLADPLYI